MNMNVIFCHKTPAAIRFGQEKAEKSSEVKDDAPVVDSDSRYLLGLRRGIATGGVYALGNAAIISQSDQSYTPEAHTYQKGLVQGEFAVGAGLLVIAALAKLKDILNKKAQQKSSDSSQPEK